MARKLWTATAFLALFAVLGRFYAKPVLAQVRAALVQNTDEPRRHVFGYQFNGRTASVTVPNDRRYIVDQYSASCFDPSRAMTDLDINTTAGDAPVVSYAPAPHYVGTLSGPSPIAVYRATGLGPIYAEPGSQIYLASNVNSCNCDFYVSGHYVLLP